MIETIKPHGFINEKIITGVGTFRDCFVAIDNNRNIILVPKNEYLKLKERKEDYGEIRNIEEFNY